MAKTHNYKTMKKLLTEQGWKRTVGGNHSVKMTKLGKPPITLPTHKGQDYGPKLTGSILKAAGL